MDDEDGGLLNIEVSDHEDDEKESRRTGQSEAEFQAVRRDYQAKTENGDIYKGVVLPLPADANKHQVQEVMHAVEELYFFRKYSEALDFVRKVRADGGGESLHDEVKQLLAYYESKCQQKLDAGAAGDEDTAKHH